MSTQVQFRRGTAAENNAFTGAIAEITVDTTNYTIRVHDGSTAGGFATISASSTETLTNKTLSAPAIVGNITGNLVPAANATYDLGAPDALWGSLYLAGNTIFLGNLTLSAGADDSLSILAPGNVEASVAIDSFSQGNSTIGIAGHNGNAFISVNDTTNVVVVTNTEMIVTGALSTTGNITGGNVAATTGAFGNVSGTLTTAAQTNITSIGTLGSLDVTGNTTSGNFIGTLNGSGANVSSISATNISSGTLAQARLANASVTLGSTALTLGATVTTVAGLTSVTSTTFVGDLTGAATTAGTVTTAAQPNITSVGTLTSVTVTGNVTGGNLTTGGALSVTGNADSGNINTTKVTATEVIGGGISLVGNTISSTDSTLTIDPATAGAPGLVVIAGNLSVQGTTTTYESTTVTINDLVFTVANNAATSAAANGGGIEVGPVGSPYATWLYDQPSSVWNTALGISATGNITGGNLSGTSIVGTLTTAAQTNITSVGTLGSLSVTGNITGGNLLPPTDLTGVVGTAALTWSNGQFHNFTVDGALQVNGSQTLDDNVVLRIGTGLDWGLYHDGTNNYMDLGSGDILIRDTSVKSPATRFTFGRTTGAFTATGNITGGNLITVGLASLSSITKTGTDGVGNIGAAASTFDTVFAKATSAQYADVAEYYVADEHYPVGTVLVFGGDQEVTKSSHSHSTSIAGVVSANPAVIMNSGLDHDNRVLVALLGRVLCRVQGPLHKGDRLVAGSVPGVAVRLDPAQYQPGCMIGKALENCVGEQETMIEVVVGRL